MEYFNYVEAVLENFEFSTITMSLPKTNKPVRFFKPDRRAGEKC